MTLFDWELRALRHLAGALLPPPAPGIPGAGDVDLAPFFRELAGRFPPLAVFGLRAAVWICTLGPLLVIGRASTFSGLVEADRVRMLEALAAHRLYLVRQLPVVLKTFVCMGYLRDPRVRRGFELDRMLAPPAAERA